MSDKNSESSENSIVETIKGDVADAAKAVVAEVKSVAAEVVEAVAAELCRQTTVDAVVDGTRQTADGASPSEKKDRQG